MLKIGLYAFLWLILSLWIPSGNMVRIKKWCMGVTVFQHLKSARISHCIVWARMIIM